MLENLSDYTLFERIVTLLGGLYFFITCVLSFFLGIYPRSISFHISREFYISRRSLKRSLREERLMLLGQLVAARKNLTKEGFEKARISYFELSERPSEKALKLKSAPQKDSLSEVYLRQKFKTAYKVNLILGIAFVFLLAMFIYSMHPSDLYFYSILSCWLLAMIQLLECYVLKFRINSGAYGFNSFEAEEIIRFIIDSSNDVDGNGGNRNILPEPEKLFEKYSEVDTGRGAHA
ncbi:hypothetical protein L3V43_05060 [Pseudoalteromonas sp. L23]|uniref:hypothetical protein n=1 Tax=unclassified Pseudoalteromonas TaxID=194690 RepID=UPI001EEFBE2B|nr:MULTISPECIES: hypothetical protein [unclassified Pseudoalteromonas]MCF7512973.1 hypothetical protein [Pseudoalteromonas sp. L7]MCF7525013.1 hypothetical protein [Pseudoalteromonas sp. L23]